MNTGTDLYYMQRCLDLARLGGRSVAPNPMVGSVVVHQGRIIGEGWHQVYGGPHAEVNAISSIAPEDAKLIPESTIYVSLEPCAHHGKTPPCAELLRERGFKRVVIAALDPNPNVDGRGLQILENAGIQVDQGLLAAESRALNRFFFTAQERRRPYVMLKWASSRDGFLSGAGGAPVALTDSAANRISHRWRASYQAIMVGANTARLDDPSLNTRLVEGANPLRVVMDYKAELPANLKLFTDGAPTLVFTASDNTNAPYSELRNSAVETLRFRSEDKKGFIAAVLAELLKRDIQSLMVEGGASLLNSFLQAGLWDEINVWQSPVTINQPGAVSAPELPDHSQLSVQRASFGRDELLHLSRSSFAQEQNSHA